MSNDKDSAVYNSSVNSSMQLKGETSVFADQSLADHNKRRNLRMTTEWMPIESEQLGIDLNDRDVDTHKEDNEKFNTIQNPYFAGDG